VVTLAVLADDRPNWRPDRFAYDEWGCRLEFQFPIVKLLDFAGREAVLEANDNPFAIVTRAQLAAMQTRHDPASRHQGKVRLIRELYDRGMSREDVLQLFRIIDWMMDLPQALEQLFRQEAEQIEQERHMAYVTSVERLAKEEGQIEERRRLLLRALEHRLKIAVPEDLASLIRGTTDLALLDRWFDLTLEVPSLEEFRRRMQTVG
jgi:hypothetical protein